jgi:hypothetical protein
MELWYGTNISFTGLTVNVPSNSPYFGATPISGVFTSNLTNVTVPEPASLAVLSLSAAWLLGRRRPIRMRAGRQVST